MLRGGEEVEEGGGERGERPREKEQPRDSWRWGRGRRERGRGKKKAGGRDGQARRKRTGGESLAGLWGWVERRYPGHVGRKQFKRAGLGQTRGRLERPCEKSSGGCPLSAFPCFGRDSEEQGFEALCCLAVLCLFKWDSALDLSHMDHSFLGLQIYKYGFCAE